MALAVALIKGDGIWEVALDLAASLRRILMMSF